MWNMGVPLKGSSFGGLPTLSQEFVLIQIGLNRVAPVYLILTYKYHMQEFNSIFGKIACGYNVIYFGYHRLSQATKYYNFIAVFEIYNLKGRKIKTI